MIKLPPSQVKDSLSYSVEKGLDRLASAVALDTEGVSKSTIVNAALREGLVNRVGSEVVEQVRKYGCDPDVKFSEQRDRIVGAEG